MTYLLRGVTMLLREPSLRPFVWKPLCHAAWIYVLLGVLLWTLVVGAVLRLVPASGLAPFFVGLLGGLAVLAAWVFLSGLLFVALAGLVSSLLWEPLAAAVLKRQGAGDQTRLPVLRARIADSVARLVLAACVLLVCAVGSLTLGPIAGWVGAALLGLLDYTTPAFSLRGQLLRTQAAMVLVPRCLPFAASVGLLAFVPLLNVLLLPACIVGGTMLAEELHASEARKSFDGADGSTRSRR